MSKAELVIMTRNEVENLVLDCLDTALKRFAPPTQNTPIPPADDDFLTKGEAAALLSCSRSTIDNAARAGKLRRHYIGKAVRFKRGEVAALVKTR